MKNFHKLRDEPGIRTGDMRRHKKRMYQEKGSFIIYRVELLLIILFQNTVRAI